MTSELALGAGEHADMRPRPLWRQTFQQAVVRDLSYVHIERSTTSVGLTAERSRTAGSK